MNVEISENSDDPEPTDNKWFLLVEEFRARHTEILHYQNETKQIVFWSVASTGALWAWVVQNKSNADAQIFMSFVIFLPLIIVLYCGLRWRLLEHFIETNSKYIRSDIEHFFQKNYWGGRHTYNAKRKIVKMRFFHLEKRRGFKI
ncbi:hypothetical protein TERTU_0533 [Teredinibacter turnerae T7901]|uniref:Uncharacterized protein n=1 Tax=Teredinibacter turnerae (strain ATCC 39867 / T7901) TaxID=377629 RepID=C5BN34_TERTT|nr:hypothetical protein [Teredinibacter turnerae]ACR13887.1 hypothetical protein TERTU_0533 [Teredinibacter turnerae T7901]